MTEGGEVRRARAREIVEHVVDEKVSRSRELVWSRMVRRGHARYVERDGVLDVELTKAGRDRAGELELERLRGKN